VSVELDAFRREYDPEGDYSFAAVKYRAGAPWSVSMDGTPVAFGLCEGFRQGAAGLEWGYVRYHLGIDRAAGDVLVPFDADRVTLHDDGGIAYGTLLRLISEKWGFELRIAHMDPRLGDIDQVALETARNWQGIIRGVRIGRAGCYGVGAGAHTHTEVVSIEERSALLDEVLAAHFGQAPEAEYSRAEVVGEYRQHARFAAETDGTIWRDYERERREMGLLWCNRFRALRWDRYGGRMASWYSSALLFGI
jgi:hypothetical protein